MELAWDFAWCSDAARYWEGHHRLWEFGGTQNHNL